MMVVIICSLQMPCEFRDPTPVGFFEWEEQGETRGSVLGANHSNGCANTDTQAHDIFLWSPYHKGTLGEDASLLKESKRSMAGEADVGVKHWHPPPTVNRVLIRRWSVAVFLVRDFICRIQ